MIDEYNDCATKSKLTITVKSLSKYNDRSRVAAKQINKQTKKQTDSDTETEEREEKDILTNRRTNRLTVDTRTQRVIQRIKNLAP